jgi:hypothetical protein
MAQITLNSTGVASDGSLVLQSNGTTSAISIGTNQNVNFAGTAQRITGDFSNATLANRVMFQTSTANSPTAVFAIPSGTNTNCNFSAVNNSDPTNASTAQLASLATDVRVASSITGTGSYLPMTFYTGGSERVRIDTSGNVGIGTSPATKLNVAGDNEMLRFTPASGPASTAATYGTFRNGGGIFYIGMDSSTGASFSSAYSPVLWGSGAYPMIFATSNIERARIDSSGNLLVGTTSVQDGSRLQVRGSGDTSGTKAFLVEDSGGNDDFFIRGDGEMYSLPTYNRTSASAANVGIDAGGGFFRSTSSIKYKTDVQDATHGLAEVIALRPVTYKGINDGELIFGGLIAEEVHEAGLTEFVQYADDGTPDALAYGNMVSLCIKAIQEQQALITTLTDRITALEQA